MRKINNKKLNSFIVCDEIKDDAEKELDSMNSKLGNFLLNSIILSSVLVMYYSINDLCGYANYLPGYVNKFETAVVSGGYASLLMVYKSFLKREKAKLEKTINVVNDVKLTLKIDKRG